MQTIYNNADLVAIQLASSTSDSVLGNCAAVRFNALKHVALSRHVALSTRIGANSTTCWPP